MSGRRQHDWGLALLAALLVAQPGLAWGPHPEITRAALAVQPQLTRWQAAYGEQNLANLAGWCWLPDLREQDLGACYADDYLLFRPFTRHPGHVMPEVEATFEPCFRRALLALRTESPANACRQVGVALHFTEDAGAPPHAKPKCPHHSELENWIRAEEILIPDYRPRLLGADDEAALAGYLARMRELIDFSAARAERALALFEGRTPDRAEVEPILLESALESARVAADLLHTLFSLALTRPAVGATLSGTITAPPWPLTNDHTARLTLVGTPYGTNAETLEATPEHWRGEFSWRGLPAGEYRLVVVRPGTRPWWSEPFPLAATDRRELDVVLEPDEPAGNLVQNPTGALELLAPGQPDRWRQVTRGGEPVWLAAPVKVQPGREYRLGAVSRDPASKVRCGLQAAVYAPQGPPQRIELSAPEVTFRPDDKLTWAILEVSGDRPLRELIERVWLIPGGD